MEEKPTEREPSICESNICTKNVLKQELPPVCGYAPIEFQRIPARTYFNGYTCIGIYLTITTFGLYLYFLNYKAIHKNKIEMRSSRLALMPLLLAERDREYLKQLGFNRTEEAELMKNVEGWEVGTWYGEPIFKTIAKHEFRDPMFKEYYAHCSYKYYAKRANLKLMN